MVTIKLPSSTCSSVLFLITHTIEIIIKRSSFEAESERHPSPLQALRIEWKSSFLFLFVYLVRRTLTCCHDTLQKLLSPQRSLSGRVCNWFHIQGRNSCDPTRCIWPLNEINSNREKTRVQVQEGRRRQVEEKVMQEKKPDELNPESRRIRVGGPESRRWIINKWMEGKN